MRITLLLLLFSIAAIAQPTLKWTYTFDGTSHYGDRAAKVLFDHSGNIVTTGYVTNRCTGDDFCTVKYSPSGQKLWSSVYTGFIDNNDNEDRPSDLDIDAQDNIFITGYSDSTAAYQYMSTVKYSPNGTELWSRRFKTFESYASSIDVDDSGNVYVAGYRKVSNDKDMLLVKYNSSGTLLWWRNYHSGFDDQATNVEADNNGSVYISGYVSSTTTGYDFGTVKYSAGGVQQWVNAYNSPFSNAADRVIAMTLDPSGNVIITGTSRYFLSSDDDIVTIKYSPSGTTVYTTPWSGAPQANDDFAKDILTDNNGNAYVLAGSYQAGFMCDHVLMKINPTGNIDWADVTDTLNDNNYPWGIAIDSTSQNIYVASDFTFGPNIYVDRDWLLQKYNPQGAEISRTTFNGNGNNFDIPFGITVNNTGEIALSGVCALSDYDTDYGTVLYDSQLNQLWQGYHNGASFSDDKGYDFYVDPTGNSYVCGSYSDNFYYKENVVVFKVNSAGQRIWTYEWEGFKIEGSEIATSLVVDPAGNTYVTGTIDTSANQTNKDIFLLKLNGNGQLVWRMYYVGTAGGNDYPVGLKYSNGKLYLAGTIINTTTGFDGLGLCYDTSGTQLWATTYHGGGQSELFMTMELDKQENIYATGVFNPLSGALSDGLVVKFNASGAIVWDSTYNNANAVSPLEFFNCIAIDSNGNAFVGGYSNQNWVTAKYTPAGIREWTQNYSFSFRPDSVTSIVIDHNNNVIVGGVFGQGSEQDFGIIKYRNDSTQVWMKKFANSAGSDDILTQIAVDDTNNIYAVGWETENFTTNYQMMVLKYDSLGNFKYEVGWNDSLGVAPDYGKKIGFDASSNIYMLGDASDQCFGNTFFNGFRWDIQVMKFGYSTSVGIESTEKFVTDALYLYPNPTKNQFQIRLNSAKFNKQPCTLTCYDLNGRIIHHSTNVSDSELNVDATFFPPGMIFVVVEQNTIRETGKIIITR